MLALFLSTTAVIIQPPSEVRALQSHSLQSSPTACLIGARVYDQKLGTANASDITIAFCRTPGANGTTYFLSERTLHLLGDRTPGRLVHLELKPSSYRRGPVMHWDIVQLHQAPQTAVKSGVGSVRAKGVLEGQCADASSTGYNPPYATCATFTGTFGCNDPRYLEIREACPITCNACSTLNFEYTGTRTFRMLSVIAEMADMNVGYLCPPISPGVYSTCTRAQKEARAQEEIGSIDGIYRLSSWGRMRVRSQLVKTVVLDSTTSASLGVDTNTECQTLSGYEALQAQLYARLTTSEINSVDGITYYMPTDLTGKPDTCGTGGWADISVVRPSPDGSSSDFTLTTNDRAAGSAFARGIAMRDFFNAGTGTVLAHELGHQLGFGHAAGTGSAAPSDVEAWAQQLAQYGDSSAVMGNDDSVVNSFTSVVRWRLGWLPTSRILTGSRLNTAFTLGALTRGLTATNADGLAATFPCPSCQTRVLQPGTTTPRYAWTGGHIWITFRGDGGDCAPDHVTGSTAGCHTDHLAHLNSVFIHLQQPSPLSYITTERWYYLSAGQSYSPPRSGQTITVCNIDDPANLASVIVCPGSAPCGCSTDPSPPRPPPSPPFAPSPPGSPPPPPAPPSPPPNTVSNAIDGMLGCFGSEASMACVSLNCDQRVRMADLKAGDRVATIDVSSGKRIFDTIVVNQHKSDQTSWAELLRIETSNGSAITVTPDHVIHLNGKFSPAAKAVLGDSLSVSSGDVITRISKERGGIINPVTTSGTILVADDASQMRSPNAAMRSEPLLASTHPEWISSFMLTMPTFPFIATRLLATIAPSSMQAYYDTAEHYFINAALPYLQAASGALPSAALPICILAADASFALGFLLHALALPLGLAGAAFLLRAARK